MKLKKRPKKPREENVVTLINIVFLMLIFFLIAGTLRQFETKDIKLAQIEDEEKQNAKSVQMRITADGTIFIGETIIELDKLTETLKLSLSPERKQKPFYILVDRELDGIKLIEVLKHVGKSEIKNVKLVAVRKK